MAVSFRYFVNKETFYINQHFLMLSHFYLMQMPLTSPASCDTFVVLPDKAKDGVVIFGKNSDRPAGEVQEIIYRPAADYGNDAKVQVK